MGLPDKVSGWPGCKAGTFSSEHLHQRISASVVFGDRDVMLILLFLDMLADAD